LTPNRRCSRCRERKPVTDFAWRYISRGIHDTYCRPCRSAYKKMHYRKNKRRYLKQAQERRARLLRQRTEWLLDYFLLHPCVDCGQSDPVVLEFDHPEGDKEFNISYELLNRPWQEITAEIRKCDVVCVNCHRIRTARKGGFRRYRWLHATGMHCI